MRNISKAETMFLAKQYITMLEAEVGELSSKNEELQEDCERLKQQLINCGGIVMQ
jgi:hypothetical protein